MAPATKAGISTSGSISDADIAREKALLPLNFVSAWNLETLFSSNPKGEENWHYSTAFMAGGYRWRLALHPTCLIAADGRSYWSLSLKLEDATIPPSHFIVETILESYILNENKKQNKRKVVYEFQKGKSEEEEPPCLVSLETLNCPSSGFLVVEVSSVIVQAEEDGPSSQPEEEKTEYTWKIDGFSKLTNTAYQSSPFLIGGKIWNLNLYPKGSQHEKCLSLYLALDNASSLPSFKNVYADFGLIIVDQIHGTTLEKRTNQSFSSNTKEWGYRCLVSLGDLHDPSKGFLVNDSCTLKVVIYSCK